MTAQHKRGQKTTSSPSAKEIMIVNDDPGVETRIAILENGRLEELYTERTKAATGVGNIYKARVTNVESAVQAAFIEYGGVQRGFLHVTDLHPKYFPGKATSERVGKKIAKHARPPIQHCLKRGDEILVQVLKEGIGTKGPTLTSYLSIPGRLSVMMPYMDKIGVSRKIEDEDQRREMRKVLDSLNLPSGFGFILRTAGLGKKSAEVKRDVAYLLRLWKMIEKRIDNVGSPCPLYNESDLLIRTIRDILRPSISTIIVDSESAHERISSFLKIAAPRSTRNIIRCRETTPIFHVFDIERQIEEIHTSKVHLPSGGCLVINQTEALVAIDVNSGKSRGAKNSEENAFHTNLEAADEICRQLRLRDLGGIVINDLIDMGSPTHRRKVEQRFQANLERDRARSSVLPISRFGLMEMTRQRVRPSVLDSHYIVCEHCDGRGHVKTTEEVAADATRYCGWLLHFDRVRRVELVCSSIVGSYLLSNKRCELEEYEATSQRRIVVRISEEFATDQVVHYAYDERGSDLDITKFTQPVSPTVESLIKKEKSYKVDAKTSEEGGEVRRRSRRRGRKKLPLADGATFSDGSDIEAELASLEKPKPAKTTHASKKQTQTNATQKKQEQTKAAQKDSGVSTEPATRKNARHETESPAETAMRVYQFARKIGKTSQEVIELCKAQNIEVRNHMSTMTAEVITSIQDSVRGTSEKKHDRHKRRRRRRGSGRHASATDTLQTVDSKEKPKIETKSIEASSKDSELKTETRTKKKRSRRSRKPKATQSSEQNSPVASSEMKSAFASSKKIRPVEPSKQKSTGESLKKKSVAEPSKQKSTGESLKKKSAAEPSKQKSTGESLKKKPTRRTLYGGRHRPVSTDEVHANMDDRS